MLNNEKCKKSEFGLVGDWGVGGRVGRIKGKRAEKVGDKVSLSRRLRAAAKPVDGTLQCARGWRGQDQGRAKVPLLCSVLVSSHLGV